MIKREALTKSEWRKLRAGMDFPPMTGIVFGTMAAYSVLIGVLLIMMAVW